MGKSKDKNKTAKISEPDEVQLGGKSYAKDLARLQIELSHLQAWVKKTGAHRDRFRGP